MKIPTVEFYQDTAEQHRWRLKHGNGKILAASSEGFLSKSNAKRNFKAVRDAMAKVVCVFAIIAFVVGCTTSQQSTAFKTIASAEATVNLAHDSYQSLVIKGALPTNDVPKVSHLYNSFQASELVALDAVQFNSNAIAPANLVVEGQDFVKLISSIKQTAK